MSIPICKPDIDDREKQEVLKVMDSGMLASGSYVEEFEECFAAFIGTDYGVATSSGTTALQVALRAAGLGDGDKVLTTPFTFIATSNTLLDCGAEPVFADIEDTSYNLDPHQLEKILQKNPDIRALLIVHLYGLPCNMEPIMELVKEYDLQLIEDCAQAHGAEYRGQKVGAFGQAAIFSFYPTKNMTTSEGGMVVTDHQEIADRARMIRDHGSRERYHHQLMGFNYRMTNIAAAIGLVQLEKLPGFNQKRRQNADFFNQEFAGLEGLQLPEEPEGVTHVYHQYTLGVDNRQQFLKFLEKRGIGHGIYYPLPVYRQPLYQQLGYGHLSLPVTEKMSDRVVSLPIHPQLTGEQLQTIASSVRDFFG
ncbi:MAG: DegT/DnrJ/EryC1/StrS family aminotransferase [Bacillota bacterium]